MPSRKRSEPGEANLRTIVCCAKGLDVGRLYEKARLRLFNTNVRGFLGTGKGSVNEEIADSLNSQPEMFWYKNNGVTILCEAAVPQAPKRGVHSFVLKRPQMINGQQTTRILEKVKPKKKALVLVRIIEIPPAQGQMGRDLTNSVARASNRQNQITAQDLKVNDPIQIYLDRYLRTWDFQYIRKKEKKGEARLRYHGKKPRFQVPMREMAQALAAIKDAGWLAKSAAVKLFEKSHYDKLFAERDGLVFLSRWFMYKCTAWHARGKGNEVKEAKFLTTDLTGKWLIEKFGRDESVLKKYCRFSLQYCKGKRRKDRLLTSLERAFEIVSSEALKVYEHSGEASEIYKTQRRNLPAFFKSKTANQLFLKHWGKSHASRDFEQALEAFVEELGRAEIAI